jgi:hypothetical protein
VVLWAALGGFAAFAEGEVVITTRPRFEDQGQFTSLILSDGDQSWNILWAMPPKMQFVPVTLDTNRVYRFVVHKEPRGDLRIPKLLKVQLDGQTIYDIEVCEAHKTIMEPKAVRIAYGLVRPEPDAPPADTEQQLFPHRHEYLSGGCVVGPERWGTVYVCRQCKEAFQWWAGTATAPTSVLPKTTRYNNHQVLRTTYLDAFSKGYVAAWAWARKESLPVFGPTNEIDKAIVIGYSDGVVAGRTAREGWSGANGQRYGP